MQAKKLIILYILEILYKFSDESNRLSLTDIGKLLESEYDMKVDRKAIKRNIDNLIDAGYMIEYSIKPRSARMADGTYQETLIMFDYYISPDFTDGELRLLIDSILFSKHIANKQKKDLINKLERLSSKYFDSRVNYISSLPELGTENQELFLTIETIDEAITSGKQISFNYGQYRTDKKLYPRLDDNGNIREYIINPYQIAATNGRYYLICNLDKYDDIGHYRLDRIKNIKILDKPIKHLQDKELNLPKHMLEHIYMFTGVSDTVTFKAKRYLINDIIDWFGKDIDFFDETEDEVSVKVFVNLKAMRLFALQYALHLRVLSPMSLVDEIKGDLKDAIRNYSEGFY